MIPNKVLYTDGHTVVVTDTTLQVKNSSYNLNGITKHGLAIIRPQRIPAILLFLIGAALAICGVFKLTPESVKQQFTLGIYTITTTTAMIIVGSVLAVIAILIIGLLRERYAVRIATAEGEKNAVVSTHKEYITQILDALNQAYNFLRSPARKLPRYRSIS
ncbi:MAG TPA: DUF6232 family protein [Cyclobacteriaceae bacterium]